MPPSYPSIQSFYKREVPTEETAEPARGKGLVPGDGFTERDMAIILDPLSRPFNPTREYVSCDIGELEGGPMPVTFVGRIIRLTITHGKSKSHASATGWYNLVMRDDTGTISVKLYFAHESYKLKLGHLVSVWTPFITITSHTRRGDGTFVVPNTPIETSIFPGREASVHMIIHNHSDDGMAFRQPLEYSTKSALLGLMNLKSFIAGGNEVPESKLLVCVKSIGGKKKLTNKKGVPLELIEVVVFDETSEVVLTLWNAMIASARDWKASETVLLISQPQMEIHRDTPRLKLSNTSLVDVEPQFADADWLRKYVCQMRKKESVKQEFPEGVWDVEAAIMGPSRILFTLADIDEWVRADPAQVFTGLVTVIILEISLVLTRQRNMLMCTECCGVPIYTNSPTSTCKNCDKTLSLHLNPKIIGKITDETGIIGAGKLLWSPQAWEELFGRPVEELVAMPGHEARLMEQRMLFQRLSLVFGWEESIGKLAVLGIRD